MYSIANEIIPIPTSMMFYHQILNFILDSFNKLSRVIKTDGKDSYPAACYLTEEAFNLLTSNHIKTRYKNDTEIHWLPDYDRNPFCEIQFSKEEIAGKLFFRISYIRVALIRIHFLDTRLTNYLFILDNEKIS